MIKKSVAFALFFMLVLSGCKAKSPLAGTSWNLTAIDGQPLLEGTAGTLVFDADGQAGGNAGCNQFGASSVKLRGKSIQFVDLFQTEMACMDSAGNLSAGIMDQEYRYTRALTDVRQYQLKDNNLTLLGEDGSPLLVFEQAE